MPSCDELIARYSIPAGNAGFNQVPPPERAVPPSASLPMPSRIAIVGAGIKGLAVALELLRAFDAARLRKRGGEPQIVIFEQDDSRYSDYQVHHRSSGLLAASAVAARELLAHVPIEPPSPTGSFSPSVRLRSLGEGQAVLDRFSPVRIALARPGGGAMMSPSNLPHNLSCSVDALLDAGAPPKQLATAIDLYVTYMHKDVSARWHVRDDCPEVAALLNPHTQFGRLQRALALACGGHSGQRSAGFALLHAASFAGVLWPVGHPEEGDGCPRLPVDVPSDPPALWRCGSVVRDVLVPACELLQGHGVEIRYAQKVAVDDLSDFDIVVDAAADDPPGPAGGVLLLPDYVSREYTRRVSARGITTLHPETPWQLVTTLNGNELEVRVGGHGTGVRGRRILTSTADDAAAEVLLQLGFSLADAESAAWVIGPANAGPAPPEPPNVVLEAREVRQLLAFEIGSAPVVVAAPAGRPVATPVGRVVRCRSQGASRHGPVRSLGPSFEAGKLTVHQLIEALALPDQLNSAGADETLVMVHGLDLSGRRTLPEIRPMQRWTLFNHLGQRLRIGYGLYVGQAVLGATICLLLVCLVVVLPVVSVKRRRAHSTPPAPLASAPVPPSAPATPTQ